MKRLAFVALGWAVLTVLSPRVAQAATSCTASMTNVQFGSSDPFTGWSDVTGTLTYSCTTSGIDLLGGGARIKLCFSIGTGAQGSSLDPRQMTAGAASMSFNLYKDPARTLIWGTRSDAYGSQNAQVDNLALIAIGNVTNGGTFTVYGRIPGGQTTLVPGSYANNFGSVVHAEMIYSYRESLLLPPGTPTSCTSAGGGGVSGVTAAFPFSAAAAVAAACTPAFAVQDLDFGTQGLLTATIDTAATMSPQCTNTTPYQIGLNDGLHASGSTRRMRSGAGRYLTYELFRDAGRTQRWGSTLNVDTLAQTGTGNAQNVPIYGRVTPQNTPPAGSYSDTVTVTITY